MANHKSAAKRARQSVRRNTVNSRRRSSVRTFEKSLAKALTEKNVKALPELLKNYTAEMMRAAAKGVFKKETASRKVSRLSSQVAKALGLSK